MISTDLFITCLNQSLDDDDWDRSLSFCVAAESSLDDECFSNYTQSMWCIYEHNESALTPADLQTVTKVNVRSVTVTKRKQHFFNAQHKGKGDFVSHLLTQTCIVENHYFAKTQCRDVICTLAPFMSEKREAQSLPHAFSVTSWCESISERTH